MIKKTLALVMCTALCGALLAGCGGDSSGDPGFPGAPSSSAGSPSGDSASVESSSAVSIPDTAPMMEEAGEDLAPEPEELSLIRASVLKGPTAIGMVKLMSDNEAGTAPVSMEFTMSGSADEIVPAIVKGDIDIAAVPANLASVLYNKTSGGVRILAVNNLGVLYIVESGDEIYSVEDLRGKTLYSTGKGTTPEYALNYVLTQNGLTPGTDVTVEYKSEASEVAAMLAEDSAAVAMLPQPFVTSAQMNNDKLRVALDLTAEWDKVQSASGGSSALVTGVVVARTQFIEENPQAVETFLDAYKDSAAYVSSDLSGCAALVEQYGIVPKAAVAEKAIPACNITYLEGAEMKDKVGGYLAVLFEQNPESVGGTLPNDDFYYVR